MIERFGVDPSSTLYVDDKEPNVEKARERGFHGVRFVDPGTLRAALEARGALPSRSPEAVAT